MHRFLLSLLCCLYFHQVLKFRRENCKNDLLTSGVQLVQQHAMAHDGSVSEHQLNSVLLQRLLYEGLQQKENNVKTLMCSQGKSLQMNKPVSVICVISLYSGHLNADRWPISY